MPPEQQGVHVPQSHEVESDETRVWDQHETDKYGQRPTGRPRGKEVGLEAHYVQAS